MAGWLHTPKYALFRKMLVELRLEKGLTQFELAERLGKPQNYVSKTELGERRLDVVEFLAYTEGLGVDPVKVIETLKRDG